jgi:hypothetical protein
MQLQLQLQAERFGSMIQHPETSNQVLLLPHSMCQPYSGSMRVTAELDGRPCLTRKVRAFVAAAGDNAFFVRLTQQWCSLPATALFIPTCAWRPSECSRHHRAAQEVQHEVRPAM